MYGGKFYPILYDLTQDKCWPDSTFIKLTSFYLQHNFGYEEPTQIWMTASIGSASMIADL